MSIPAEVLQKARGEAKRRLVARAAVYHRDIVEAAATAKEHLDSLKDGGDEWAAVLGMIEVAYGLVERVDTTGLIETYIVYKLSDMKMRDTFERVARQLGLIDG